MAPRIVYSDSLEFPWVIVFGWNKKWGEYRTREGAENDLKRLTALWLVAQGAIQ